MFIALAGAVVCAAGPQSTQPAALGPGDHVRTLEVDGRPRSYLVHVPPGYDPRRPTPVVLAFHGAWMNGAAMVWFCGLNSKSDAAGFVAVYPNGVGFGEALLFFNAWAAPGPPGEGPPDDVAFTARLLDDLATVVNLDPQRVFATGMSNGGMMCHRLAAELSDRIAAIAPVAGTLAIPRCNPPRPVPVMHFHGTADEIVPFYGQRRPSLLPFESVDETVQTWIKIDGCPAEPRTTELPDNAHDGTTVRRRVYGPGTDGAEVVLYEIEGGGHTWPGRTPPVKLLGKSTMNLAANDLIWDFFCKHPMLKRKGEN